MSTVEYAIHAKDTSLSTDLRCVITLRPHVGSGSPPIPDELKTTIVLGQFSPAEVAQQATDFFMSQHSVSIDSQALQDFLLVVQKFAVMPQIAVTMNIVS
ncbi:hypothetical protein [Thiolapillus sp.]|uniref:hypothetical protein n=1 Tax=Thiolapillus sp. TaxID=2017437 RepID=UPI003AF6127C